MVDVSAIGDFFTTELAAYIALGAILVHLWRAHNERRRDNSADKAGSWERLQGLQETLVKELARLSARVKALEAEGDECRENLAAVRQELAEEKAARVRLESYLEGRGQAEQHAQLIVSAERNQDADKAKKKPDD